MKNKLLTYLFISSSVLVGITACGAPEVKETFYVDATANSIYGKLSDFSAETVSKGDTLTFKVTPSEDFTVDKITNNGTPCRRVRRNADGSEIYTTEIVEGQNKLMGRYKVNPAKDYVDAFKLNISDAVFEEVMNPKTFTDKKKGLDFRRCGIEQVQAPMKYVSGKKQSTDAFVNFVDGDTTHVETKNLGYTVKIRYLGIDTPESTDKIQEWGLSASYYNHFVYTGEEAIKKYIDVLPEQYGATSIILMGQDFAMNAEKVTVDDLLIGDSAYDQNGNLLEGIYHATADQNQRSLAYVWYATNENPTKNDFRCLNLEMVYQGYSIGSGNLEEMGEYFYKYFDKTTLCAQANQRHRFSSNIDRNYFYYEDLIEQDPNIVINPIEMETIYKSSKIKDDAKIGYVPESILCDKKTLRTIHGYVSRKVGTSFYIQNKQSYTDDDIANGKAFGLYCFTYAETDISVGDEVNVVGALSSYGGTYQVQGLTFTDFNPTPRDTKILSSGNTVVPVELTGAEFNAKKLPQVLVSITDPIWCYDFTSTYKGNDEPIGEGGSQAINKYNEYYPFYNTSNTPIFYGSYGEVDNAAEINSRITNSQIRYTDEIIRFTVDQEIIVSYQTEVCYNYMFFTGGTYLYNPKGADFAVDGEPETELITHTRKKMTKCVVISKGYESTGGNRKMTALIASGRDLAFEVIE